VNTLIGTGVGATDVAGSSLATYFGWFDGEVVGVGVGAIENAVDKPAWSTAKKRVVEKSMFVAEKKIVLKDPLI
jgi:hypothetical protein